MLIPIELHPPHLNAFHMIALLHTMTAEIILHSATMRMCYILRRRVISSLKHRIPLSRSLAAYPQNMTLDSSPPMVLRMLCNE